MAQFHRGPLSFIAAGAIPKHALVQMTTTAKTVDVNGLATIPIGSALNEAFAAGDMVAVQPIFDGTHKVICSEAVEVGDLLYTESDGEVQDTAQATSYPIMRALTAGSGDQAIVEAIAIPAHVAAQ